MRIEEGKYYRDANGTRQGPLHDYDISDGYGWSGPESITKWWSKDGKAEPGMNCVDLISEWSESPVRTVTRQEIIPGTYDGVGVNVGPEGELFIEVTPMATRDPARIERAAAVLTALAGALRDE